MMDINPLLLCDGYKLGHRAQYPDGTEGVYSNWTARGSRIPDQESVVFFGLQYFLKHYLGTLFAPVFNSFDDSCAEEYLYEVNSYLGPDNNVGSDHVSALQELGFVPLEFRALPEGTHVPLRVPMFTFENTHKEHPEFFWLTNYIETKLSATIWPMCTSATTASRYRKILDAAAAKTGGPPEFVDWQAHDFSFRGMFGVEAAIMSGAAHLLFFTGTDTFPSLPFIRRFYGQGLPSDYLIGSTIPATEHSVMCAGSKEGELETFRRLLTSVYPIGPVSGVSDTWDYWNVLTQIIPALADVIMEREGKLVVRPDSGDPVKIVVGDPDALPGSPEHKGTIELLWETFGGTMSATGYKLLDPHIGAIYGDSITEARALAIVEGLAAKGFASTNIVFGIGSYTYQFVTRDVYMFAGKGTWVKIDGEGHAIFKDPITDSGTKKSAKGRLAVLETADGGMTLINEATEAQEANSLLRPVWRNGEFLVEENFATIRERARSYL